MAILGLDLGRRIGVAIAEDAQSGAYPVGAIERRSLQRDLESLRTLLRSRNVDCVVVGLPLNMDGSEGRPALAARAFAIRLAEAIGVRVELYDERLTSFEAEERLKGVPSRSARGKGRKAAVDALAATIILEGWLQSDAGSSR